MEVQKRQSRKLVVEVHESVQTSVRIEREVVGSSPYQSVTHSSGHSEVPQIPMSLSLESTGQLIVVSDEVNSVGEVVVGCPLESMLVALVMVVVASGVAAS